MYLYIEEGLKVEGRGKNRDYKDKRFGEQICSICMYLDLEGVSSD